MTAISSTESTHNGHDYDYLIIGSGFGGSVSALRLAEKGWRVGLLEQGERIGPKDIARAKAAPLRSLFWQPLLGQRGYFAQPTTAPICSAASSLPPAACLPTARSARGRMRRPTRRRRWRPAPGWWGRPDSVRWARPTGSPSRSFRAQRGNLVQSATAPSRSPRFARDDSTPDQAGPRSAKRMCHRSGGQLLTVKRQT